MEDYIKNQLLESADVKMKLATQKIGVIAEIASICIETIKNGGKIMFCGNGGSAADSQHLATELVVRLSANVNRQALPGLALTTDTSILTACANDYGFDKIFARQVEALGREGDMLVAISTSGNSPNVLHAVEAARETGMKVIGFTGSTGGKLLNQADKCIVVPSDDVQRIQECHIAIGHIIISLIEQELIANG